MAADLTIAPWNRLARLAPPRTASIDLQEAADRYLGTSDLNAAAADLWEEFAVAMDAMDTSTDSATGDMRSVTQDGIRVEYENPTGVKAAKYAMAMEKVKYFRRRTKATSVLMHRATYDSWTGIDKLSDDFDELSDRIIPIEDF